MSTKQQQETAAERYRRIRAEKDGGQLHDVACPSGMVFKCRRVSVPFLVTSGILPLSLVELMSQASEKGGVTADQAFNQLPVKEKLQSIEFATKLVKFVCVEPRIVDEIKDPNDILPEEVDTDDFNHIVSWAMRGGEEAARLDTFRQE